MKETEEELQQYPDIGKTKLEQAKEVCYDCLKTRAFWVTLGIMGLAIGVMSIVVFGIDVDIGPPLYYIWSLFYLGVSAVIFICGYISYAGIHDYCDKNDKTYKENQNLVFFGIFAVAVIFGLMYLGLHVEDNFKWMLDSAVDERTTVSRMDDGTREITTEICYNWMPFDHTRCKLQTEIIIENDSGSEVIPQSFSDSLDVIIKADLGQDGDYSHISSVASYYKYELNSSPDVFVTDSISCDEFRMLYRHTANHWYDGHPSKEIVLDNFRELRPDCNANKWQI